MAAYANVLKASNFDYINQINHFQNSNSFVSTLLRAIGADQLNGPVANHGPTLGLFGAPGHENTLELAPAGHSELLNSLLPREFCFAAGTTILMADGCEKSIEHVGVGDVVMAFGLEREGRGTTLPAKVVRLFGGATEVFTGLSNGLVVTPGHHFLDSRGTFRPIEDILRTDGIVVLDDGSKQQVSGEVIRYSEATAHLFEQGGGIRCCERREPCACAAL